MTRNGSYLRGTLIPVPALTRKPFVPEETTASIAQSNTFISLKKIILNLVLLIGSIVVAIILCELAVQTVAPQQLIVPNTGVWRPDSVFGYAHTPNADLRVNTGERETHFISDEYGYRINQHSAGTAEYEHADVKILAIGDSFLEALAIENEETFPEVIAQRLADTGLISVHVTNAGVGGRNPNHYYLEAKRSLQLRDYDLAVVALYTANDCVEAIDTLFSAQQHAVRHYFHIPKNFSKKKPSASDFAVVIMEMFKPLILSILS